MEVLLVGDSLGMVVLGYDSTLPVTLDEMLHHVRAVRRGTKRALLVADMPYGSFHVSTDESIRNAMRLIKEGGAEAVKIEGGERRLELISRLVEAEIPVMGHVGLTPQSINALGGFHVQGKTVDAAKQLERDAKAVEDVYKRQAYVFAPSNHQINRCRSHTVFVSGNKSSLLSLIHI